MIVVSISAFYHDSAAVIVRKGEIVAAAQEERFSRRKYDARFPVNALRYCLDAAGIDMSAVDYVAFYDKPFLKFERLLETYLAFAPRGFKSFRTTIPVWLREKLFLKNLLVRQLRSFSSKIDWHEKLLFAEHHLSHAASAFYPSPFDKAAVLTLDGVGEWATSSVAIGVGNELSIHKEIHFPHSLGLLYSAFTYYMGFKVNSGEYKLMGLAPYGEPKYVHTICEHLIDIKQDGSYHLNMDYFDYCTGLKMTNDLFASLFGGPPRGADEELTQRHMDLAASVQATTENVILKMSRSIAQETGMKNLCLAGGVALNCIANGKVLRDEKFESIWVQPASGDAGGALGAALSAYHGYLGERRDPSIGRDRMQGAYLGPAFEQTDIEQRLMRMGAVFDVMNEAVLVVRTAADLAEGKAVGWFQGRMEFGPRALGCRSILADARLESMQSVLNLKVKKRESFRPFAPSVLREDVTDWFELDDDSPSMSIVAGVKENHRRAMTKEENKFSGIAKLKLSRSEIPAVTHVDYSAHIQTVHADTNRRYHALIKEFKQLTGCPVIVNTSFNVRGEPIVGTPEDAFRCFMGTELDVLAIGNCYLSKRNQGNSMREKNYFEPD